MGNDECPWSSWRPAEKDGPSKVFVSDERLRDYAEAVTGDASRLFTGAGIVWNPATDAYHEAGKFGTPGRILLTAEQIERINAREQNMSREAYERMAREAAENLARLDRVPDLSDYPDDTVVFWKRDFGRGDGIIFSYAAVKAAGYWYGTGRVSARHTVFQMNDSAFHDSLCAEDVSEVSVVTAWEVLYQA